MLRKGFIIDTSKFTFERSCTYDDKRIDGMFYKVEGDLIPIAYIFPEHVKDEVMNILAELRSARKTYDDFVANMFYKILPKLR
jgi:hypothetical protein